MFKKWAESHRLGPLFLHTEQKWAESEERDGVRRFFAGIPKIPNTKKDSMGIYLCFIQHIIYSLAKNGKAAIVVPTPFLTKGKGIIFLKANFAAPTPAKSIIS